MFPYGAPIEARFWRILKIRNLHVPGVVQHPMYYGSNDCFSYIGTGWAAGFYNQRKVEQRPILVPVCLIEEICCATVKARQVMHYQ